MEAWAEEEDDVWEEDFVLDQAPDEEVASAGDSLAKDIRASVDDLLARLPAAEAIRELELAPPPRLGAGVHAAPFVDLCRRTEGLVAVATARGLAGAGDREVQQLLDDWQDARPASAAEQAARRDAQMLCAVARALLARAADEPRRAADVAKHGLYMSTFGTGEDANEDEGDEGDEEEDWDADEAPAKPPLQLRIEAQLLFVLAQAVTDLEAPAPPPQPPQSPAAPRLRAESFAEAPVAVSETVARACAQHLTRLADLRPPDLAPWQDASWSMHMLSAHLQEHRAFEAAIALSDRAVAAATVTGDARLVRCASSMGDMTRRRSVSGVAPSMAPVTESSAASKPAAWSDDDDDDVWSDDDDLAADVAADVAQRDNDSSVTPSSLSTTLNVRELFGEPQRQPAAAKTETLLELLQAMAGSAEAEVPLDLPRPPAFKFSSPYAPDGSRLLRAPESAPAMAMWLSDIESKHAAPSLALRRASQHALEPIAAAGAEPNPPNPERWLARLAGQRAGTREWARAYARLCCQLQHRHAADALWLARQQLDGEVADEEAAEALALLVLKLGGGPIEEDDDDDEAGRLTAQLLTACCRSPLTGQPTRDAGTDDDDDDDLPGTETDESGSDYDDDDDETETQTDAQPDTQTTARRLQVLYRALPLCSLRKARAALALGLFLAQPGGDRAAAECVLFEGLCVLDELRKSGALALAALPELSSATLRAFGVVLLDNDKYPYAVSALEACALSLELQADVDGVHALQRRIAVVAAQAGDTARALTYYLEVLERCKTRRHLNEVAYVAEVAGRLHLARGEFRAAAQVLLGSLRFLAAEEDCGALRGRLRTEPLLLLLARVVMDCGAPARAVPLLRALVRDQPADRRAQEKRVAVLSWLARAHELAGAPARCCAVLARVRAMRRSSAAASSSSSQQRPVSMGGRQATLPTCLVAGLPGDADLCELQARADMALGRVAHAVSALNAALAAAAPSPPAPDLLLLRGKVLQEAAESSSSALAFPMAVETAMSGAGGDDDLAQPQAYRSAGELRWDALRSYKRAVQGFRERGSTVCLARAASRMAETCLAHLFPAVAVDRVPLAEAERVGAAGDERRIALADVEGAAQQALALAKETCLPLVLLRALTNMAELRFLQGLTFEAMGHWGTARDLALHLFADGTTVPLARSGAPGRVLRRVAQVVDRLARLLLCCERPLVNQNLLLLDLAVLLQHELSRGSGGGGSESGESEEEEEGEDGDDEHAAGTEALQLALNERSAFHEPEPAVPEPLFCFSRASPIPGPGPAGPRPDERAKEKESTLGAVAAAEKKQKETNDDDARTYPPRQQRQSKDRRRVKDVFVDHGDHGVDVQRATPPTTPTATASEEALLSHRPSRGASRSLLLPETHVVHDLWASLYRSLCRSPLSFTSDRRLRAHNLAALRSLTRAMQRIRAETGQSSSQTTFEQLVAQAEEPVARALREVCFALRLQQHVVLYAPQDGARRTLRVPPPGFEPAALAGTKSSWGGGAAARRARVAELAAGALAPARDVVARGGGVLVCSPACQGVDWEALGGPLRRALCVQSLVRGCRPAGAGSTGLFAIGPAPSPLRPTPVVPPGWSFRQRRPQGIESLAPDPDSEAALTALLATAGRPVLVLHLADLGGGIDAVLHVLAARPDALFVFAAPGSCPGLMRALAGVPPAEGVAGVFAAAVAFREKEGAPVVCF